MAGIAVLFILVVYVAAAIAAVSLSWRRTSWKTGLAVLAVVVILPTADALIGRELFDHYCQTEGQLVIRERVNDVEGIAVQGGVYKDSPAYYGYRYVEGGYSYVRYQDKSASWMFERAEVSGTGEPTIVKTTNLQAKYILHQGLSVQSSYFNRSRVSVKEIDSGRELGGFTNIGFRGGWAEQTIFGFASSGPKNRLNCPRDYPERRAMTQKLLHSTLVPAPTYSLQTGPAAGGRLPEIRGEGPLFPISKDRIGVDLSH